MTNRRPKGRQPITTEETTMAIYTRFGSEIEITGFSLHLETGIQIRAKRTHDGSLVCDGELIPISQFKADGGIQEIEDAVYSFATK